MSVGEAVTAPIGADEAKGVEGAGHGRAGGPPLIIEPSKGWPRVDFRELWAHRGLFFFLVWRDIKVRYAQTVLGAAWAVIQPVVTMVVFTVIFGMLAGIDSEGMPYAAFSLCALVPWTYLSTAINGASMSLVGNPELVTKVYFPRLVIPAAPVLAGLLDLAIAFVILIVMLLALGIQPGLPALWLVPTLVGMTVMTAVGTGCWLAALNIRYRDVKHVTPFLVQLWMYASPIVYPLTLVPERFRTLYSLNPMVAVVEGFRTGLAGSAGLTPEVFAASFLSASALLVSGVLYFRYTERVFADVA